MRSVTIQIPTWTPRTVTLPDVCPGCGADLTDDGFLRRVDLLPVDFCADPDVGLDGHAVDYDKRGERTVAYGCTCGRDLTTEAIADSSG